MRNKRGVIGETITWIPAFLVIFFVMMLFLALVALISVQKKPFSTGEDFEGFGNYAEAGGRLNLQREFVFFANSFSSEIDSDKFKNEGGEFLSELGNYGVEGSWVRIFGTDETIVDDYSGVYKDYFYSNGDCEITDGESKVIVLTISKNKKAVLCARFK